MSRLSIELSSVEHRQIKALAAYNGLSLKDFILTSILGNNKKPKQKDMDETQYLLSSPANAKWLKAALETKDTISFKNIDDLKNALGV